MKQVSLRPGMYTNAFGGVQLLVNMFVIRRVSLARSLCYRSSRRSSSVLEQCSKATWRGTRLPRCVVVADPTPHRQHFDAAGASLPASGRDRYRTETKASPPKLTLIRPARGRPGKTSGCCALSPASSASLVTAPSPYFRSSLVRLLVDFISKYII